jgi:hypothetical protein
VREVVVRAETTEAEHSGREVDAMDHRVLGVDARGRTNTGATCSQAPVGAPAEFLFLVRE